MFIYTTADLIFGIIALVILVAIVVSLGYLQVKQWMCKHKRTFENMACSEICRDCNKNLGFIGRNKGEK